VTLGTWFTVSVTLIGAIVGPDAEPMIVSVCVPTGVKTLVPTVNVELLPVVELGLNVIDTPAGNSGPRDKVTVPAKFVRLMLIV
jgi:hypothetical protein